MRNTGTVQVTFKKLVSAPKTKQICSRSNNFILVGGFFELKKRFLCVKIFLFVDKFFPTAPKLNFSPANLIFFEKQTFSVLNFLAALLLLEIAKFYSTFSQQVWSISDDFTCENFFTVPSWQLFTGLLKIECRIRTKSEGIRTSCSIVFSQRLEIKMFPVLLLTTNHTFPSG